MDDFLLAAGITPRPLKQSKLPSGVRAKSLYLGQGSLALEVVVYEANSAPADAVIHEMWTKRRDGRAAPVLTVILQDEKAVLCGSTGTKPPIYRLDDVKQVERLCSAGLRQPDRNCAIRFLSNALPTLETELAGFVNQGMLSTHELAHGTRERGDWEDACRAGSSVLARPNEDLLAQLGFKQESLDNLTLLLKSDEERTALAVMLQEQETPEGSSERFNQLSPLSYALNKADKERLDWVLLLQKDRLRLYAAKPIGVSRRSRTEAFVECQPCLLSEGNAGLLWLLFSAEALAEGGTFTQILGASSDFAGKLADRLKERIYDEVVPALATGIVEARDLRAPGKPDVSLTYEMALTVLFRLLFIAYAEDRDLLPYRRNESYRRRSLKAKAKELAELAAEGGSASSGYRHWEETSQLWRAVSAGDEELGMPAYNGVMFSSDPAESKSGAEIDRIKVDNKHVLRALSGLLLIKGGGGGNGLLGPVDFRSLSVREFGTIYEGLLESELSIADQNLALDRKGTYVPAGKQQAVVKKGAIYLHDRSGARKHSGSYYTPAVVVEHLLDGSLESALDDHFARLEGMDEVTAAERFFDFRIADIAMGSGHFLVAALDRIEARMVHELDRRPLPGVGKELAALREAARASLGEAERELPIEDGMLLRRLIARRCIYGVDLNRLSVQLARLSIWIHTFVPGLPLSFLDHSLVQGNSVVGVGGMDEIERKVNPDPDAPFLDNFTEELLGWAKRPLQRLANSRDATVEDIRSARNADAEARSAVRGTEALCDLVAAQPISASGKVKEYLFEEWVQDREEIAGSALHDAARADLKGADAFHFPVRFPEIFLRANPGFDVIVGNPPWQEATIEKLAFWARHFPGLRGLDSREQTLKLREMEKERPDLGADFGAEQEEQERIRRFLTAADNYPGMGTGDPDLYKAFCWRFWNLVRKDGGRLGVVLPRSALAARGSEAFRKHMIAGAASMQLTLLLNQKRWIFPEVHPQYTIGLCSVERGAPKASSVHLNGPFHDKGAFVSEGKTNFSSFAAAEVLGWSESASFPMLPSAESVEVFRQLRKAPNLLLDPGEGTWRARPDSELHATSQKHLFDMTSKECPKGYWPVYKGESFDIWNPDTGRYYGWADPEEVKQWLFKKRMRGARSAKSAHSEFLRSHWENFDTLACNRPRIAFRDITNRTNTRTVIASLIPPKVFITNQGPYLLWPRGDEKDQAYLLGVLSSIPLDWYARRFVELHLSFYIFNSLPIPRVGRDSPLWQRIVSLSARLACHDERYWEWMEKVGEKPVQMNDEEKQPLIRELDAVVAHLYGLSENQLTHIFETFQVGWDFAERLEGVLCHYREWEKKLKHEPS